MNISQKRTKQKILVLSLAYFPLVGGAEVAVCEITKRLGNDFSFDLLCARLNKKLSKRERIGNINVYRVGFGFRTIDKYFFTFFGFFKALKLHLKNRYKIIWPVMAAYSSFAVLFKIFTKCRVLLTIQEGDSTDYIENLKRFKFFKTVYKLYFKKVDKVQAISNFLGKWAESLGVRKEKIVIVPNGVNLSLKHLNTKTPFGSAQGRLKHNKDEKIILTVSRLVKKNGVEDLIKAFKLLITHHSLHITHYTLLIIGDGPLKNKLQNLVEKLKLEDKVVFAGSVKHDEIAKYYAQADVFARPSLSEGLGNVFLEAMANNLPVVATPVGGITDFLVNGTTGWFCEVQNPESVAEKIVYILDEKNKDEVRRVVQNARKMVEEKYTWDKIAEQMRNIFIQLV